ncbi:hypothetical protein ACFV8Z_28395 [Streptomyces sp. NPDC059837]|uniref:hypothetical protein n=1 Tax=Streptomyces sp. NPDC059837 TaxID=3346968 RepID=UPI00365E6D3C
MTVRRPGGVSSQAMAASIRLGAAPAPLRTPYRANARSWMSFGDAAGVPPPEPQAAREVQRGAVRLQHLHARREVFQEVAQPLQEFGVVAGR